jgi:hypothetical protein
VTDTHADDLRVLETDSGPGLLHLAARWWPALAGLPLSIFLLVDLQPWRPAEPTTAILPGLAIAYLVFGAVRRQYNRPGVLPLQIVGLVIFGGCAIAAALVDPEVGKYIAAAGWIGHAAWDVAHHRDLSTNQAVGVVPRGYAEFCIVLDLLIGASLIAAPVA